MWCADSRSGGAMEAVPESKQRGTRKPENDPLNGYRGSSSGPASACSRPPTAPRARSSGACVASLGGVDLPSVALSPAVGQASLSYLACEVAWRVTADG